MLGEFAKSPMVKAAVVAVIVIILLSYLHHSTPPRDLASQKILAGNLQEAVGYVAAEEAGKLLGDSGGSVALIVPGPGDRDEKRFPTTLGGAYERGFQKAAKKLSKLKFSGHFLADPAMHAELVADWNQPTFLTFKLARQQFPNADVLVSMVGLPDFNAQEESQWLASSPPKLVAVHSAETRPEVTQRMLQSGLVQVALVWKNGMHFPDEEPTGEPREVFNRYYFILTRQ